MQVSAIPNSVHYPIFLLQERGETKVQDTSVGQPIVLHNMSIMETVTSDTSPPDKQETSALGCSMGTLALETMWQHVSVFDIA